MVDVILPAPRIAPRPTGGPIGWLKVNLFSTPFNSAVTVVLAAFLAWALWHAANWAIFGAIWAHVSPDVCKQQADGACWAFIAEKYRLILFGRYPFKEQWRPLLAVVILIAAVALSCNRAFWKAWLAGVWLAALAAFGALMWGGRLTGLTYVETSLWGGLPLTLILAVVGIVFAFPFAILLALGRRSHMPAARAICVAYIELIRGVPLISLLFMASFMLPLFLQAGTKIDALLRAQVAIIMFTAAYLAEVIRGGLQAIPKGQYEAAAALGLGYWQSMRKIILPQAIRAVIPPIVNTFIGCFKDTSLVAIVSLTDLLLATKQAISDPNWRAFFVEGYVFIALIYFFFCFFMSRYSQHLERTLHSGTRR
jgi:general L-amino acid transport system permease protein